MFLELVDSLRCPRRHEATWLVAVVERFHGRHVAAGSLGCPICKARFRVEEGAVDFTLAGRAVVAKEEWHLPGEDAVMRARALLGLAEPGGTIALVGDAAALGAALEDHAQVAPLLVNPVGAALGPGVSTLWVDDQVPVAADSLRGAIVGTGGASPELLASLVMALRQRARLVAPVALPMPGGMSVLARDDREWVAERSGDKVSAPVSIGRRPAPSPGAA